MRNRLLPAGRSFDAARRAGAAVLGVLMGVALLSGGPALAGPGVDPPTGVTASAVSPSRVNVAWSAVRKATSYHVLRSTTSGGPYATVATTSATTSADTTVTGATTYYYVVTATMGGRTSGFSTQASATTPAATPPAPVVPAAPANLRATPDNYRIYLSWDPSSGASGYDVLRGTTAGGPYDVIGSTGTPISYTDTPPQQGVTLFYVVRALGGGGVSRFSNEVSARTAPPAPAGFTATAIAPSAAVGGHVDLSWRPSAGAEGYVLERQSIGTNYDVIATLGAGATSYTDFNVAPSTAYYYRLKAFNPSGSSFYAEMKTTTAPAP